MGGESTHCVLSGHRGLPSSELLTNIDRLERGDLFRLHVLGETLTYRVDQVAAVELGDYSLLGMLRIPEAGLELPVMSQWSYPLLAAAPCRYSGSLAGGDLVILGHSYRTHFRGLRTIQPGAAVELTDAGGEIHRYRVAAVETVRGSDSAALASDWPLTLFTCTADRRHRVLVRCENA